MVANREGNITHLERKGFKRKQYNTTLGKMGIGQLY